ncbi:MAG: hypothetical protein ABIL46_07400 [candidate division WOR-3 bacterium]
MQSLSYLAMFFSPVLLFGQVNVDTIFLWDNDYGKQKQIRPSVGANTGLAFIAWQDARWNDFDIYRQGIYWNGNLYGTNTQVSIDTFSQFQQIMVDAEGNPDSRVVFVWEDSSYRPNQARATEIWARIFTGTPFRVYGSNRSQKIPSVSCRNNGEFVVTFTDYDPGNFPRIHWRRFSAGGSFINYGISRTSDSLKHHIPVSRVAYCDSGFVVVYDDSSRDGTQRSVYVQYLDVGGTIILNRQMISNPGAYNEDFPAVAVNQYGFGVIVWQYWYSATDIDIYARTFQMRPGSGTIVFGSILQIDATNYISRFPRVTVFPNGDYFVVWEEGPYPRSGYDIVGRAYLADSFKPKMFINNDTLGQYYPDVECRNTDTCCVAWQSEELEQYPLPDTFFEICCRAYFRTNDNMIPYTPTSFQLTQGDTIGGRKGWYFDDENYDNPATPNWNEDPIDEADSVFVDLEAAILDQLSELNTNNQYFVVCAETLPPRNKGINDYDAVFIDLGFRTDYATAGIITQEEQTTLITYINSRFPTMVEGNDFGSMYYATNLYNKYGATYLGDGAHYVNGNIDTLYGCMGTSFADETLKYQYKSLVDNYPDSISPRAGYELILRSSGAPGKWATGRTVGWGNYWKGGRPVQDSFKIYSTFPLSGIKSTTHPNTYAEFYRRCLGYLGLNCQPEPITTLTANPGSSEGMVTITWRVVSDDKPSESAEGPYRLKFARKKMTSESAFNDSSETYYQNWNTASQPVGTLITQNLYGLPPMDTLIFALKVSDESGLWNALGAEPRAVVAGDSVTPHTITFGQNYVKDFSNKYEYMNRRRKNDTGNDYDSLFVTWDYPYSPPWFEVGFARCNLNIEGDLFIYVDTKSGGADSTVPYNGTAGRSGFFKTAVDSFRPDYCLIIENSDIRRYRKWVSNKDGRGSWVPVDSGGTLWIEDNVINNYMYSEGYIRYDTMGYTAGNPFKLVVLMTEEATNSIINAFPISNPLGTYRNITQYYYWGSDGLTSGKVPASREIIGVEETTINSKTEIRNPKLTACPNPFKDNVLILLPDVDVPPQDISLKIYDVSGRLVKQFNHLTIQPFNQVIWDGTDDNGRNVPQGIYFCKFATPVRSEVEEIIYLK